MKPAAQRGCGPLVTGKLMCLAYLQIGIMQAGFYAWMLVLNDYGFSSRCAIAIPVLPLQRADLVSRTGHVQVQRAMRQRPGQVDPEGRDPSRSARGAGIRCGTGGDAGYLGCSFAAKNFNGRRSVPGFTRLSKEDTWGSEVPSGDRRRS